LLATNEQSQKGANKQKIADDVILVTDHAKGNPKGKKKVVPGKCHSHRREEHRGEELLIDDGCGYVEKTQHRAQASGGGGGGGVGGGGG